LTHWLGQLFRTLSWRSLSISFATKYYVNLESLSGVVGHHELNQTKPAVHELRSFGGGDDMIGLGARQNNPIRRCFPRAYTRKYNRLANVSLSTHV
jgi:hypothetical protein